MYATYLGDAPVISALPLNPSLYVGARTGLLTINGGRAYGSTNTIKFGGETFQLGPVIGLVSDIRGFDLFVEGSYMWRDFKSVEWDTSNPLSPLLPRRLNMSGASIATGIQFSLKP